LRFDASWIEKELDPGFRRDDIRQAGFAGLSDITFEGARVMREPSKTAGDRSNAGREARKRQHAMDFPDATLTS